MAGGAEAPGFAREGQQTFRPAARTADPGKPALRVAAVEITLDHLLDDRPEKTVLPLEKFRLFDQALTEPEVRRLMDSTPLPAPPPQSPEIEVTPGGRGTFEVWVGQPGRYELKTAGGTTADFVVADVPEPMEITGPWDVSFAPNLGAPDRLTFETLISWSEYGEAGVRYFSGPAVYRKTIQVAEGVLAVDRRLSLDLGKVAVMAEVKLNGRDLGILWKAPFRVDVTDALRADDNALEVKVVDLWINRQIGDEQLPEDSDRNPDGTLKAWPRWLMDGRPSPTGRIAFTSWRLWKKDDPLVESGLLGPVILRTSVRVNLKPGKTAS